MELIIMPSVKGKGNGGRRQSAGRPPTGDIHRLVATAPELVFDVPAIASADVYGLGWCLQCGAVWWEAFGVVYRQGKPNTEADDAGDFFPVLAEETRPRQPEQHYKFCPLYTPKRAHP